MLWLVCLVCISESKHVFTDIGHLCYCTLTGFHSAKRGSKLQMPFRGLKPHWELGMVGPEMNWRVCPAQNSKVKKLNSPCCPNKTPMGQIHE